MNLVEHALIVTYILERVIYNIQVIFLDPIGCLKQICKLNFSYSDEVLLILKSQIVQPAESHLKLL